MEYNEYVKSVIYSNRTITIEIFYAFEIYQSVFLGSVDKSNYITYYDKLDPFCHKTKTAELQSLLSSKWRYGVFQCVCVCIKSRMVNFDLKFRVIAGFVLESPVKSRKKGKNCGFLFQTSTIELEPSFTRPEILHNTLKHTVRFIFLGRIFISFPRSRFDTSEHLTNHPFVGLVEQNISTNFGLI